MKRWLTFIGGYYSPVSFCVEAREMGVSRVISRSNARQGIEFGDTALCASWAQKKVFAEFRVDELILHGNDGLDLSAVLLATGKGEEIRGSGGTIVRECGSYLSLGAIRVKCGLQEILDLLDALVAGSTPNAYKLMIAGPLTAEHAPPLNWEQADVDKFEIVWFRRGFIALGAQESEDPPGDQRIHTVTGYKRRKRKMRQDIQTRMPV